MTLNPRRLAACLTSLGLAVGLLTVGPPAQAAADYTLHVKTKTPDVRYFKEFLYETATVRGPDEEIARTITRRIRNFTQPWPDYYLKPSKKTLKYLKQAEPAYFETMIVPTENCHHNFVCLSQGASFATPLLAGSVTGIHARAWSTRTGKKATLRTFVSASELPRFTDLVKSAIRKDGCYYGFEIELPARYESFPDWVPLEDGIAIWFPEYQFGCQPMALRVAWH